LVFKSPFAEQDLQTAQNCGRKFSQYWTGNNRQVIVAFSDDNEDTHNIHLSFRTRDNCNYTV